MSSQAFGPIELYLIELDNSNLGGGLRSAFSELLENGTLRLLDLILISRDGDGFLSVTEVEDSDDPFGGAEFAAIGIAGDEDIAAFAEFVPPSTAAALIAVELLWAKSLAAAVSSSGTSILASESIPAPAANALAALLNAE